VDADGGGAVQRRDLGLVVLIGLLLAGAVTGLYFKSDDAEAQARNAPPPASPGDGEDGPVCQISPGDGQDAIAAAIESCPDGSTVRFPPEETYHQSDKIAVVGRSNLVIDGNGSTFVSSAPNDGSASIYQARPNWELVEGARVTLRNMTIRGNLGPGRRGILAGNQYNAGIVIYGGDTVRVSDVGVFSVFGEFVVSNPSGFFHGEGALAGQVPRNVHVDRLYGEGAARQCVAVTAADGFWLTDSTVRDCYQNGVDIEPDVAGEPIHDVHVVGNTVTDYYFSAIAVPTAYAEGDVAGIEIRDNATSASDTCYPAVLLGGVQANSNALYDVVVVGNRLETLNEGVRATNVASGSVSDNRIALKASPNLCGPPRAEAVRLVQSALAPRSNAEDGYGG
jgi:hypothetical protein